MTDRSEELDRFKEAVERKSQEAEEASRSPGGGAPIADEQPPDQGSAGADRPQDTGSPREKNTGHRKKTADKWNQ